MDRKLVSFSVVLKPLVMWVLVSAFFVFGNNWGVMRFFRAQTERLLLATSVVGQVVVTVVKWPMTQITHLYNGQQRLAELESRIERMAVDRAYNEQIVESRNLDTAGQAIPMPAAASKVTAAKMLFARNHWVIRAGTAQGVATHMTVLDENGAVLGLIGQTGTYISEVIPFYDQQLQVAVAVVGKPVMGLLKGDGTVARITDVPQTTPLALHDIVVTDSVDDLFPPGLVIGQIIAIESKPSDVMQTALVELTAKAQGTVIVVD